MAAIKAQTRSAEELFGEWKILREADKTLCTLMLSKDMSGADTYKLIVLPGCDPEIAAFGLTTWRLDATRSCSPAAAAAGALPRATPPPGRNFRSAPTRCCW
jgi:hypothetical protein